MALSSYTDIADSVPQMELLPPELRGVPDPWNYIDYFFEPNDFFFPENPNSTLLHDFTNEAPFDNYINPPFLVKHEHDPFHFPKRQKRFDIEDIYSGHEFKSSFFDGFLPNCDFSMPEIKPDDINSNAPPVYENNVKKESLSAQSIAARQRRRKITEKTQELGKLVPGAQKMNTAEMLQAGYKYIKYLQAQVGVLELIHSYYQESPGVEFDGEEEFRVLVGSTLIQEKMYSTENCLVPEKFIDSDNKLVKLNPIVKEEDKSGMTV